MKILILSASVGAGHVRAAEATEAALRAMAPQAEIVNYDVLPFMPEAFQKLYRDAYFGMVAKAPKMVGWIYEATDKPFHNDLLLRQLERVLATPLLKKVREFDPDVAVCTHFLPATLLERERRKGRTRARIITVVTDIEVHGMWLATPSDHYFVATDEARVYLEALGVEPATITASGIPTHPIFGEAKDRMAIRRKNGWPEDLPVILVSAGGVGAGNVERLMESLVSARTPACIVAVCGRSAALKSAVEKMVEGRGDGLPLVKVAGFTTEMDEFMTAADVMIGKPGGLTTSESLVKGLAWVVVNPIPGQEEKNAIYLLENGAGVWCDNWHTLAYKVKLVLETPGRLQAMRANALRLGRPGAGKQIAEFVLA